MRRFWAALAAFALVPAALLGQVKTPPTAAGEANKPVYVQADTGAKSVVWLCFDKGLLVTPQGKLASKTEAQVVGPPGTYRLLAFVVVDGELSYGETVLTLTGSPTPPDPGPGPGPGPGPDPGPGPKPPTPPTPTPAPIPLPGLRVLMLFEAGKVLPAGQMAILNGQECRDAMNAKCVMEAKSKGWRVWPANTVFTTAPKHWQDAAARPRTGLPWLIISNGVTGYEGPLPATPSEFLTLLGKYELKTGGKAHGR
jgi:hypothetical protein